MKNKKSIANPNAYLEWPQFFNTSTKEKQKLEQTHSLEPRMQHFLHATLAFEAGDHGALADIIDSCSVQDRTGEVDMLLLLTLRLQTEILCKAVEAACLRQAENYAQKYPLWAGELNSLMSKAHAAMGRLEQARDHAKKAQKEFKKIDAAKRSVLEWMQAQTFEFLLHPEKDFLPDLNSALQEALDAKENFSAGLAAMQIAREYQKIQNYKTAIQFSDRAVDFLREFSETHHYFAGLAQRAALLCQLGREKEARLDIELASACSFADVQNELAKIAQKYPAVSDAHFPATGAGENKKSKKTKT